MSSNIFHVVNKMISNIFHVSNKAINILYLYQVSFDKIVKDFLLNLKPPYISFKYEYMLAYHGHHGYSNINFSSVIRKYNILYFVQCITISHTNLLQYISLT